MFSDKELNSCYKNAKNADRRTKDEMLSQILRADIIKVYADDEGTFDTNGEIDKIR